ncbi:VOC family protein [Nocardia arizonensis]|uniref:VOC family protein n=1 Tax=Nocardia arizonensis TaxID=1141647 RepID=UPI0006D09DAF|nr:VOC family protein [Nocardia arizonensis]
MTIASGPIFQLCWVVPDIAAATREFTERYGVADWFTIAEVHFGSGCRYRDRPADYTAAVALGYAGGQQLELIEPGSGDSPYADHLARHGSGLHHVAWVVDDLDSALARARTAGREILAEGVFGDGAMTYAYLDGGPLGTWVELLDLSTQMKAMFDGMAPRGHRNPWG